MSLDDAAHSDAVRGGGLPDALRAEAQATAARAVQYLLGRQSPGGGFCFYRWRSIEEPSLADTWHALSALTLLGARLPRREQTIGYLQRFLTTGFDQMYYRTLALARFGIAIEPEARVRIAEIDTALYLQKASIPVGARLKRALQMVRLQQYAQVLHDPDAVARRVCGLCNEGGWGDKPNLHDTWSALAILDVCGRYAIPDASVQFVDALQVSPFGFTATPDSNYASLDIVHAGLRACRLLGLRVRYPRDATAFVLACQFASGGFARTPGALPGIDLTHGALLGLAAAGALSVPDTPGWRDDCGE